MWLTWVWSPTSHAVPRELPKIIPEYNLWVSLDVALTKSKQNPNKLKQIQINQNKNQINFNDNILTLIKLSDINFNFLGIVRLYFQWE